MMKFLYMNSHAAFADDLKTPELETNSTTSERITTQKMKFSIKDFFSKCDQIRSFLWIWSHLLKKSWMENFIFGALNIHIL